MKYIKMAAQVILVLILSAILSVFFAIFSPDTGKDFLDNLVGAIPICDTWIDLLSNYSSFDMQDIPGIYIEVFFEATILGICMVVSKKIADFLHITRLLPFGRILVTFVGVLIGSFLCDFLDAESSALSLVATGLIIVYGLLLMIRSILPIHNTLKNIISLKDILLIVINGLVSVILAGYITTLYLFADGLIKLSLLLEMCVLAIGALVILYSVDGIEETKKFFGKG